MFGRLRKKEAPAPIESIPEDAIPFLSAADLLSPYKGIIKKIRDDSGASKDFFDRYYLPAIERMAEILQLRPFGHSGPFAKKGGAIEIAVKRVALALKLRQGALLPLNCKPEEISHRGECWTYGVFAGALLREFGGQLLGVKVIGFSRSDKAKGEWHGWYEPLTKYHHYRMRKNDQVSRSLSKTSSIMHMTDILPASAIEWMYDDSELMDNLLDLLAGANKIRDNPIQALIMKASITLKDDISFEAAEKSIQRTLEGSGGSSAVVDEETGEIKSAPSEEVAPIAEKEPEIKSDIDDSEEQDASSPATQSKPESSPEPAKLTAQNFIINIRNDIAADKLTKEQAFLQDNFIHIMYPSVFKVYTDSPAVLLNELRDAGKVVKEMERKGKTIDRRVIIN